MTTTVGIREIARDINLLNNYDYVDVEDKKSHDYKGLFVSPKYAGWVKKMIEEQIADQKQKKIDELFVFVGIADGDATDISDKDMKSVKAKIKSRNE